MISKLIDIEKIYPLTIVSRRYGGFAIINAENDCSAVDSLSGDEEWSYTPRIFMYDEWSHLQYGIGKTILEAYEDYLTYDENTLKPDF